jgi:Glycosyltransferases involved in cell wall biogenesis
MVKISVILPVYGVEKYLHQCVQSLLSQTLEEIEIIAVDDGSPDKCPQILDEYASKDSRIQVIHKKNAGVSAARNDGFEKASGEYVFFCDSDDWMEKDALAVMYQTAIEGDADVVITDHQVTQGAATKHNKSFSNPFITTDRNVLATIQKLVFPSGNSKMNSAVFSSARGIGAPWHHLIRTELIRNNQLSYDSYLRGMFDDGVFMLHVFEYAKKVAYISKIAYNFRVVEGSITHRFRPDFSVTFQRVFDKIEEFAQKYAKGEAFWHAYYIRVYVYLSRAMENYFFHPENTNAPKENYRAFKLLISSDPYKTAIQKINIRDLPNSTRIVILLLRSKLYRVYWMLKEGRIRREQKKRRA